MCTILFLNIQPSIKVAVSQKKDKTTLPQHTLEAQWEMGHWRQEAAGKKGSKSLWAGEKVEMVWEKRAW